MSETWRVVRQPDIVGAGAWHAWRVPLPEKPDVPDWAATLSSFLLFCPGAHMGWSYWSTCLIHLRPIEGVRPAVIRTPGATHEIMTCALNPAHGPDPDNPKTFAPLLPFDLEHQLRLDCDADAVAIHDLYVRHIMSGVASPDSDFCSYWERILSTTAAHYRAGMHGAS